MNVEYIYDSTGLGIKIFLTPAGILLLLPIVSIPVFDLSFLLTLHPWNAEENGNWHVYNLDIPCPFFISQHSSLFC